jgi:nucleotide-binding universal stress UspA family protein
VIVTALEGVDGASGKRGPKVIMGFDGSEPSVEALRWAARQADSTGSLLEVIMAWEWPASYGWSFSLPESYSPDDEAQSVLDVAAERLRGDHPRLKVQTTAIEGRPGPTLVAASHDADLLVVGSRGHGSFSGMLLGSVSQYCVAHAACPVVVYRDQKPHPD